ncbi:hypothetical protein [Pelagicoccus sp. SDUM812002]|uniref:hypothetical protein n=1 Tax=Pelagicoccus sp. SDUM812002 TaxID=3041266 RepID=UPI00280FB890|nr:hypothetical protein [Pelagicoccus sp. SDUM812002]MDQ8183953.1 hypothetical protein [Pelagicoccus sp. SDUM812002]
MAKSESKADFRAGIRSSLINLSTILERFKLCKDTSMLRGINIPESGERWAYEVNNLKIELGDDSRTSPEVEGLYCVLDIVIEGVYPSEDVADLIKRGGVQFRFVGLEEREGDYVSRQHCWHHDRHEFLDGNSGEEDALSCAHPLYHLTYGGKHMKALYKDDRNAFGSLFVADAFRVTQPPMDVVLAVDFVVSNFSKKGWADLLDSTLYQKSLSWSQKQFWKPYYSSIGKFWDEDCDKSASEVARGLVPQLV